MTKTVQKALQGGGRGQWGCVIQGWWGSRGGGGQGVGVGGGQGVVGV